MSLVAGLIGGGLRGRRLRYTGAWFFRCYHGGGQRELARGSSQLVSMLRHDHPNQSKDYQKDMLIHVVKNGTGFAVLSIVPMEECDVER